MNESVVIFEPLEKKGYQLARELLREYASIRDYDVALGDIEKELSQLPGEYARPNGCLLVAKIDEKAAGMLAIRRLSSDNCEMKRLFVTEKFKGRKIGFLLIDKMISIASEMGYNAIYLDTHPWMKKAEQLYLSIGFKKIAPYNKNPTPGIKHFIKVI